MKRILLGLLGAKIQGSLAPFLHEDACAAQGIDGHYHLMDVEVLKGRTLPELFAAARATGFAGVNVTFPFKEAVIPLLDVLSPEAGEIGAVNTVVFDADGRSTGYNTDRSGFRRAFAAEIGAERAAGKEVLLLGAGGAGRAVSFALMDTGIAKLKIYDSDRARLTALLADLAKRFGPDRCEAIDDPTKATKTAAGIVNATPVGMKGVPGVPIALDLVEPRHFVADVIYSPLETELVLAARAKQAKATGGSGMCVQQAVDAFRHFTGREADGARMFKVFAAAATRRDGGAS
jgi:shikimate dehydrogenase